MTTGNCWLACKLIALESSSLICSIVIITATGSPPAYCVSVNFSSFIAWLELGILGLSLFEYFSSPWSSVVLKALIPSFPLLPWSLLWASLTASSSADWWFEREGTGVDGIIFNVGIVSSWNSGFRDEGVVFGEARMGVWGFSCFEPRSCRCVLELSDSCFACSWCDNGGDADDLSSRPIALVPGLQGLKHKNYPIKNIVNKALQYSHLFKFYKVHTIYSLVNTGSNESIVTIWNIKAFS